MLHNILIAFIEKHCRKSNYCFYICIRITRDKQLILNVILLIKTLHIRDAQKASLFLLFFL